MAISSDYRNVVSHGWLRQNSNFAQIVTDEDCAVLLNISLNTNYELCIQIQIIQSPEDVVSFNQKRWVPDKQQMRSITIKFQFGYSVHRQQLVLNSFLALLSQAFVNIKNNKYFCISSLLLGLIYHICLNRHHHGRMGNGWALHKPSEHVCSIRMKRRSSAIRWPPLGDLIATAGTFVYVHACHKNHTRVDQLESYPWTSIDWSKTTGNKMPALSTEGHSAILSDKGNYGSYESSCITKIPGR